MAAHASLSAEIANCTSGCLVNFPLGAASPKPVSSSLTPPPPSPEEGRSTINRAMSLCDASRAETEGDALALRDWAAGAWDYLAMGNYPYPSVYIVNGAQPPLPAFPVRVACEHLSDLELGGEQLLAAMARAVGVFYNHTRDLDCYSFKQGPNPETGGRHRLLCVCVCVCAGSAGNATLLSC
jgi:hypothetical protein